MSQLFTELQTKTPPEGKYVPRITVASTEDEAIVQAVADSKEARVMEEVAQPKVSDDGRFVTVAVEDPNSERQNLLAKLEAAEKAAEQELRDFQPLTEADNEAKQERLSIYLAERYNEQLDKFRESHPDFDEVFATAAGVDVSPTKKNLLMEAGPQAVYELIKGGQAEQFAQMSDAEAEKFLQGKGAQGEPSTESTEQQSEQQSQPTDYDHVLSLAAERGNLEATAETLDRITHPDTPQLAAVNSVMTAVLANEVPQKQWAPVVHALLSNPETAGKLETADSADVIVSLVKDTAKQLRLAAIKQQHNAQTAAKPAIQSRSKIVPMKPVGGSARGSVAPDQMPYQDYRKWREANRRKY